MTRAELLRINFAQAKHGFSHGDFRRIFLIRGDLFCGSILATVMMVPHRPHS